MFLVILLILFVFCELLRPHLFKVTILPRSKVAQRSKSFIEGARALQAQLLSVASSPFMFNRIKHVIANAYRVETNTVGFLTALAILNL